MQDPPVIDHMEVENVEAATNTPEANDHVLADDRVEPEANAGPEANENLEASASQVPTDGVVPPLKASHNGVGLQPRYEVGHCLLACPGTTHWSRTAI